MKKHLIVFLFVSFLLIDGLDCFKVFRNRFSIKKKEKPADSEENNSEKKEVKEEDDDEELYDYS